MSERDLKIIVLNRANFKIAPPKKPEKAQGPMWTTKGGERICVYDMRDSHIINTYNLLKKNKFIGVSEYNVKPELIRQGYKIHDFVDIFIEEAKKRGINLGSEIVFAQRKPVEKVKTVDEEKRFLDF